MPTGNYKISGKNNASENRRYGSGDNGPGVSEKEDLSNYISMITRDETPFYSSIGKNKATDIYHEWQTDELASPRDSRLSTGANYDNIGPDGKPASPRDDKGALNNFLTENERYRTRLGNYCQINGKNIAISNTKRALDQTGLADEYAYQIAKRGTELRRDVEATLLSTTQTAIGSSEPRQMGTLGSWLNKSLDSAAVLNSVAGIKGATGVHGASKGGNVKYVMKGLSAAAMSSTAGDDLDISTMVVTDTLSNQGTNAPVRIPVANRVGLRLSYIDDIMQRIHQNGGKASTVMVSPKLRKDFSAQAQAAGVVAGENLSQNSDTSNVTRNIDEKGTLRQSVDYYRSDFGLIMIMSNYIMGLDNPMGDADIALARSDTEMYDMDYAAYIYNPEWFKIATLRPLKDVDVGPKGDSTIGMMVEEFTLEVKNPLGSGAIYGLK